MPEELNVETQQFEPATQEQSVQQTQQEIAPQAAQQQDSRETNMRYMRERIEAAERRNAELEALVRNNMMQKEGSQRLEIVDDEDQFDFGDEEYLEGKKFKKYAKNLKRELAETKKQMTEILQKNSIEQAELRLKSHFDDFDTVVTKENLEKLAAQKPAIYRTIMANNDIYDKGYAAYEFLKSSGIGKDQYAQQERLIDENKNKPRSAASVAPQSGETPLARVGDYDRRVLTEERKAQLRRQVEEAKRNY